MALIKLIAHAVSRPQTTAQTQLSLRDEELDVNGITEELFHDIKQNMLKRSGKEYGRFSDQTVDYPCGSYLKQCLEGKMGFVSMSKKIAAQFQNEMDKLEVAFEGYLFIAQEKLEDGEHFQIAVLQHERGLYLNNDIHLEESFCLDVNAMRLSARVNVADWLSDDAHQNNNAICMTLWRGEKELSEVFTHTIGFSDKVDIAAETEQFVEVLNAYTKDIPEDTANTMRRQVVDYCEVQKHQNKPVVLEDLSNQIHKTVTDNQNADSAPVPKLDHYVKQHQAKVAKEFMADTKQIKSLVRIAGRNDQLSMSFASSCLGESVLYDPATDTLTVTNIPTALKNRLKKHIS